MAAVNITGIYTLNSVNVNSTFEDTTDYDTQGLNPGDFEGYLKAQIETSSGAFAYYDNIAGTTPDITPGVASVATIPMPVDPATNFPVKGIYTITYGLKNIQTSIFTYYTIIFTYDFDVPEICIQQEVNCGSSLIRTTDVTKYTAYLVGDPDRTHILYPPPASALTPKSVTTPINIYNNIVTTTWTCKITSICTWFVPTSDDVENVFFIASITDNKEIKVDCNTNLCSLMCCVEEVWLKYKELICSNTLEANRYKVNRWDPTNALMIRILAAQGCGKPDKVAALLEELKVVSGCTGDCGCNDEGPQVVLPSNGSSGGNVVVTSPGGTISVVPVVDGDTTTYEIAISPDIITTINSFHNTEIVSSDNSITVTGPALQPNGSWRYNIVVASSAGPTPNIDLWLRVENISGWTVTPTYNQLIGTNVSPSTDFKYVLGDVTPGNPTTADAVIINITDFFVQPQVYTCSANVMKYDFNVSADNVLSIAKTVSPMEAQVMYANMDVPVSSIYVRLIKPDGSPVLFSDLEEFGDKVDIRVTIKPQVS